MREFLFNSSNDLMTIYQNDYNANSDIIQKTKNFQFRKLGMLAENLENSELIRPYMQWE